MLYTGHTLSDVHETAQTFKPASPVIVLVPGNILLGVTTSSGTVVSALGEGRAATSCAHPRPPPVGYDRPWCGSPRGRLVTIGGRLVFWFMLAHLATAIIDLAIAGRRGDRDQVPAIVLLRQQVRLLQRRRPRPPRLTRAEQLTLAVLTAALARLADSPRRQRDRCVLLCEPDTILAWHRALVRRTWTDRRTNRGGRPRISPAVEALIRRLARESPRWGHRRIHGELDTRGYAVSTSAVRAALRRWRVPPAPRRRAASPWRDFIRARKEQLLACACFTVETLWRKTLHILCCIAVGTRRVHFADRTARPTAAWVTQQARNLAWTVDEAGARPRFLLHDRDAKFSPGFDAVFAAEEVAVVRTPYRAPTSNAYAERWVRSVRAECLDQLLIVSEAHLRHVLASDVAHDNRARPHRGLGQQTPIPCAPRGACGPVSRRDVLGGLIHEYDREAASPVALRGARFSQPTAMSRTASKANDLSSLHDR